MISGKRRGGKQNTKYMSEKPAEYDRDTMRCFVAINIDEQTLKRVQALQKRLREKATFTGKLTRQEHLHLTLKFLGEIDEKQINEVKQRLKTIKFEKLNCSIDSLGVFCPEQVRIVWLHMAGLDHLQKQVDEVLKGLFQPETRFMSHLTIARVKQVEDKQRFMQQLQAVAVTPVACTVDSFSLVKSELTPQGPVYTELACFKAKEEPL